MQPAWPSSDQCRRARLRRWVISYALCIVSCLCSVVTLCFVSPVQARHKGWLNKRGGRIHTWHKRWFVLTGDLLFYYKSPQVSKAHNHSWVMAALISGEQTHWNYSLSRKQGHQTLWWFQASIIILQVWDYWWASSRCVCVCVGWMHCALCVCVCVQLAVLARGSVATMRPTSSVQILLNWLIVG